jgi:hypothetical protein
MSHAHIFATSGGAYNASQTNDRIVDGDILLVPSESRAAVLVEAWPVYAFGTAEPGSGAFDQLRPEATWQDFSDGRYLDSAIVAVTLHTVLLQRAAGLPTDDRLLAIARDHGWEGEMADHGWEGERADCEF